MGLNMSNATVTTASSFLDSLGINTKAGAYTDAYTNSSLIIRSLDYLGISHVRDSYSATGHANAVVDALANAGISFDFRVSYTLPGSGSSGLASYVAALAEFKAEHPGALLSIEGINEANLNSFSYNGLTSLEGAAAFQQALYAAVKANGVLSDVTVVNFSIGNQTDAMNATVGDMSAYSDAANAHVYVHTGALADGQIEQDLALAEDISTNDPVIVTETGYTTLSSTAGIGVNEDAQAKLILSNLLLAYEDGSSATYLYELFDTPSSAPRGAKETSFGLFNADGTPKEAAVAVHNLTTILSHGDDGSAHTGADLSYTLSNAPSNTHTMLMNKSGAVSDLVVWADTVVWDSAAQAEITTPVTSVTVNFGQVQSVIYVYDPLKGTTPIAVYYNTSTIQIGLSDHPLVIEVGAASAAAEPPTTVDPDLTMTSAAFVAQMDTLASATTGLEKVTLSDSHVLAVSSSETMQYVIAHYGDLLSKIDGGYSFSITWSGDGWTQEQDFDANGSLTETIVWGVSSSGAIISKSITLADGRVDYYHYGITGQSYTSDHTAYDASGKVTLIERFNADGSYQYKAAYNSDGSKVYDYYSSTGALSTEVGVTSISTVTTTYDTSTGYKLRVYTSNSDGSADNKVYTNGVLMKDNVLHKDGSSEVYVYNITGQSYTTTHQVSDASGKVTLIERFHADGSYQYKVVYNSDGSKVYDYYTSTGVHSSDVVVTSTSTTTTTYDTTTGYKLSVYTANVDGSADNKTYTNGVLMKDNVLNKDGSSEVYVYNVAGQSYTTIHQYADASGKVALIERFHADGSYQYKVAYNSDGSKVYDYYTSTGVHSSEITVTSTGTTTTTYDTSTGYKISDYIANVDGSAENKTYTSGVLTKDNVLHKDGSSDVYVYKITGQSYTSTHQAADASGNVTLVERFHSDGTYDYKAAYHTDGSKLYDYYTSAGKLSTEVSVTSTGTTTTTYDTLAGYKLTEYTANVDGSADNKTYTSGVLTKDSVLQKDGSSDVYAYQITGQSYTSTHQAADASGSVTLVERFHSDGSYDYLEKHNSDGSKEISNYSSAGAILNHTLIETDGSRVVDYYSQDGTGDIRTDTADASGNLTMREYTHTTGAHEVYAYADNLKLAGGTGNDTFYFRSTNGGTVTYQGGNDTVYSFNTDATSAGTDKIAISSSLAANFSGLHITQQGSDALITLDSHDTILLKGTTVANLHSEYFVFT